MTMTVQTRPVLRSVSMVTTVVAIVTEFSAVVSGPLSQHVSFPLGCPVALAVGQLSDLLGHGCRRS